MPKQSIKSGRSDDAVVAAHTIENLGYEVRCVAADRDGIQKWSINQPDPQHGYNPRSYFTREGLIELASLENKQEIVSRITAAEITRVKYLTIKGESYMQKKQKKSSAATERATREARTSKSKKAVATKGKGTKAQPAKVAKKASTNGHSKASNVDMNDPDVQLLASYQEQTTTERMTAKNMVTLFKRIKAASASKPIVHADLNAYDKRQARELARLGLVVKEKLPDVGLAYVGTK